MCKLSTEVVTDILERGRIYEVGGAVRDRLLFGRTISKDRDYLVTGIDYDELSRLLRRHGRVDLVGRSFGVIKFTQSAGGEPVTFDISLPRREFSTGWGHRDFDVSFDPNLSVNDDLVRRDFTINAMAVSLADDALIDPLGGRDDLRARCIRMVHERSFEEDPLRMLRAIQFAARFQFDIEPTTLAALTRYAAAIQTVSAERIAEELNKLLVLAAQPSPGFHLMHQTGLLREILPELDRCVSVDQPGGYHAYDVFEHTLRTIDAAAPRLRLRLAALFHDISKPAAKQVTPDGATFYGHELDGSRVTQQVMKRLRYPNDLTKEVSLLVERHMFTTAVTEKGMRRLIRRVGVDLIFDLLDLRRADVIAQGMGGSAEDVDLFEANIRAELERKPAFSVKDLAVDGHDLMRTFSLKPGPIVGDVLDYLLEQVLDDPGLNQPELLMPLARAFLEGKNKDVNNGSL